MKPTHIVIHNSATKDTGTVSWAAIRRYHKETLNWSDIGYHFGVEQVGEGFEMLTGRMPDRQGAHCRAAGMNTKAIGVCCVGDFEVNAPPTGQLELCLELVRYLMRQFNIPKENIIGHREVESKKTCPGSAFDLERFRSLL